MKLWTEPHISPLNPKPSDLKKEWRVRFRYNHDGKWIQKSFTHDINRIKDFKTRLQEAKALKILLTHKLKIEGWNPINDTYSLLNNSEIDKQIQAIKIMPLNEAIQFTYNKKKTDWSPKTCQDYGSMLKYFKSAARHCQLHHQPVNNFQLAHFKLLMESVSNLRKLSASGYNKYRDFLSTLVEELIQWDILQYNFVHSIKLKKTLKRLAHQPPSVQERELIIETIKQEYPTYYLFLCVLYGCTLRPKEILSLRISDICFPSQTIRLLPENAKTGTERNVMMPDWLMKMFQDQHLEKYQSSDFVFSAKNKLGSFLPGPRRAGKNIATRTWKKIVKDGLGLNITQYSLKKMAGDDMVRIQRQEHLDKLLELPRQQMGHANTKQTEVYVTEHIDIINEVMRKRMPVL